MSRKHLLNSFCPMVILGLLAACGGGQEAPSTRGGDPPLASYQGTFRNGPSLQVARRGHVAIALSDGRALILGGVDANSNPVTACELYDPSGDSGRGSFQSAGTLPPRNYFAATLLADGRVLVTGGEPSGDPFHASASSAVFDPTAEGGRGVWVSGPDMPEVRTGHSLFGLPDGRAIVSGGNFNTTNCFQLDPSLKVWSSAGSTAFPHFHHGAALLTDGRVLIAGGDQSSNSATADLFDSLEGTFRPTGNLCHPRFWFGMAPLPGGKALVVGGVGEEHSGYIKDPELFDPALQGGQGGFIRIAAQPQSSPTILVPLLDGRVILIGSASVGVSALAELFDAAGNQGQGSFTPTGSMSIPRQGAAAVRLKSGRVLVTGGMDAQRAHLQSSEIFQ